MSFIEKLFGSFSDKELKKIDPIAQSVLALEDKYTAMSEDELRGSSAVLKQRLADGETLDDILPDAFATCREASWRVLSMKHFPVQIVGGISLHNGCISEMKTGEGKTLVATLPVYLNALSGEGVHVVTVNDYLAKRDSEWMGKVYRYLGLTVGLVVHGITATERKAAYVADITYGTNNEYGFDYLRDNMVTYKEQMVQRGHSFAIVDEVDSILVDEARTPLIISGEGDKSTDMYSRADKFARTLTCTRFADLDDKEEHDNISDTDYIVVEKKKTVTLSKAGVEKAESYFKIENLSDASNMTLSHHINQAIRAHGIMKNEVDYVVRDGEVLIVDEFTGRLMVGRRYNEGLHQAIEAKEGVKVEKESKTLATVTFQNYFRMYKKLAGMTGTAKTEAEEFTEIYGLSVIEIPPNRPIARDDMGDVVYSTEAGKYNAVIDQIVECHAKGQPVLVGTISIEKSEYLGSLLKKRGVKHEVLNAKYHEKEAEIIAQAGKFEAVTIATNMAGRGTDIMLGGNSEYMAKKELRKANFSEELINEADSHAETDDEEILAAREAFNKALDKYKPVISEEAQRVKEAGGLFIIGTERHESRRIDNQLRGRAGRQGDEGVTRFYLSLEDDLMRLFGGERVQGIMTTLGVDENTPIESKAITNIIESAQKKIEGQNFAIRKSVLSFDDVMNQQREIIYGQRAKVLKGDDVTENIFSMVKESIASNISLFANGDKQSDWDISGIRDHYRGWLLTDEDLCYSDEELKALTTEKLTDDVVNIATQKFADKEVKYGPEIMRELERVVLLRNVDSLWMEHIDNMDELRKGIYLRSYGQRNPVIEYRIEGFDMFDVMVAAIKEDTTKMLMLIEVAATEQPKREQLAVPVGESAGGEKLNSTSSATSKKVGRNDLCPCGSGLKHKKCTCAEHHDN